MQTLADFFNITPTLELRHFVFLSSALISGWAITILVTYANLITSSVKVKASDLAVYVALTAFLIAFLAFLYAYGADKDISPSIPDVVYEILDDKSRTPLVNEYFKTQLTTEGLAVE